MVWFKRICAAVLFCFLLCVPVLAERGYTTVYVTSNGVYHSQECQHLWQGYSTMALENASQLGYVKCSSCEAPFFSQVLEDAYKRIEQGTYAANDEPTKQSGTEAALESALNACRELREENADLKAKLAEETRNYNDLTKTVDEMKRNHIEQLALTAIVSASVCLLLGTIVSKLRSRAD